MTNKNVKCEVETFSISSKGIPAPLNIATPTPAPDRGGPVA